MNARKTKTDMGSKIRQNEGIDVEEVTLLLHAEIFVNVLLIHLHLHICHPTTGIWGVAAADGYSRCANRGNSCGGSGG